MNIRRIANRGVCLIIIGLIIFVVLAYAGNKMFMQMITSSNQNQIDNYFEANKLYSSNVTSADIKKLKSLLNLKLLDKKQYAEIYTALTIASFNNNENNDFLEYVPYALFYTQSAAQKENAVYLYSTLSKYYLEIGADDSAFDMILNARKLSNFYKCESPVTRAQALHVYGRYLIKENDFEDAEKAYDQLYEDSLLMDGASASDTKNYLRAAMAFKSYLTLLQGKTEEAYKLACDTYKTYFNPAETLSRTSAYDFLIPIFYVKTQWAIRTHNYKEAIEFNKEYGKICNSFGFVMKKTKLAKDLMFALPVSYVEERQHIFEQLAIDTDILAQSFLDQYTTLTDEKLQSLRKTLEFNNKITENRLKNLNSSTFAVLILLVLLLIMYIFYSETQIDGLTKLRNRRALDMRIRNLEKNHSKYIAIMLDIDNFKRLNDTYGHDYGDYVLRNVANILIRNENRHIRCYRYGGEEMVAILEHYNLEQAVKFSEKVRSEICTTNWEKQNRVTASFGVGTGESDCVKQADENMYYSKQKGKNFTTYKKDGKQYLAERRLDIRNPVPDPDPPYEKKRTF